jgi:effector-binding domain-containing protein
MACAIHTGANLFLGQAYAALYRWIKENGYQVIAPPRQLCLRQGKQINHPAQYITEVQFSIAKQEREE